MKLVQFDKVLNPILFWPEQPQFSIPELRSVQKAPLFRIFPNPGLFRPVPVFLPILAFLTEMNLWVNMTDCEKK